LCYPFAMLLIDFSVAKAMHVHDSTIRYQSDASSAHAMDIAHFTCAKLIGLGCHVSHMLCAIPLGKWRDKS
jgi:hypothetical protein